MGITWREAQRRIRVIRAVELLAATGMTVTEVSLETGYRSLSAFNSAFRYLMGVPPSMYRRTMMSRSQGTEASTLPTAPEARAFDVDATYRDLKKLPVR
jgi:AraC-like DNA-binding protein